MGDQLHGKCTIEGASHLVKLLIVDDQKGIRRLLTEVFSEYGYEIESYSNGIKALEIIPVFKPDLVIMDVKMPGMNGIDVLKKLREADQDVQVIMMTAYGDQQYVSQAEELGVAGFIIKPFDLDELKRQVGEILKDKNFLAPADGYSSWQPGRKDFTAGPHFGGPVFI